MAMLTGCGSDKEDKTTGESAAAAQTAPTVAQTEPPMEQTEPTAAQTESDPYVTVGTPYGDLYYQSMWSDCMKTEQTRNGDALEVSFSTQINGKAYLLFVVVIGPGDGTPAGELTDAEGTKREVSVRFEELAESPELTEGERNRLYAMQEEINYVIDNLK